MKTNKLKIQKNILKVSLGFALLYPKFLGFTQHLVIDMAKQSADDTMLLMPPVKMGVYSISLVGGVFIPAPST